MEILLEEKKKEVHKIIDEVKNEDFLDRILAFYELENLKVNKESIHAVSNEEIRKMTKERIALWWKK